MKVFWDPSYKCNAQCQYCFTESGPYMPQDNIRKCDLHAIIDRIIILGASALSIGGGEPFLTEFDEICEVVNGRLKISVTTNGSILNSKIINTLRKHDVKVTVSLDSLDKEHFENCRKGLCLEQIVKNIKLLAADVVIRKNLSIRMTINKYNMEDVYDLVYFCEKMQIPKLKINSTNYFGRAKVNPKIITEFSDFMCKLAELERFNSQKDSKVEIELPIRKYLSEGKTICSLGKNSIYVNPKGIVFPCAFSENLLEFGNIITDNIADIIEKKNKFCHDDEKCERCVIHRYESYY